MAHLKEILRWQTISGEAATIGDLTVTPQSQALTLRLPFGGLVWNRPVAVLVERGGGTERIPVVDVTRVALLGLLGLSSVFSIVALVRSARRRRTQNER